MLLLFSVVVLLAGGPVAVRGQSALDGFDPNANGQVKVVVVQPEGKILAGGIFPFIGGQLRHNIARLKPDGTLDPVFDPNANNYVDSIAVQADGKVLAGGFFTTLAPNGGAVGMRSGIARLETDGRLDQTLNLGTVGNFVTAAATQRDGKILIGGSFHTVLGVARNYIARLNTDGTLDIAFNPNATNEVDAIAVQSVGKILAGFSEQTASADSRAITSPGSMPPPDWPIRSTRTRTILSVQSRRRRTERFYRAAISLASADSCAMFSLV